MQTEVEILAERDAAAMRRRAQEVSTCLEVNRGDSPQLDLLVDRFLDYLREKLETDWAPDGLQPDEIADIRHLTEEALREAYALAARIELAAFENMAVSNLDGLMAKVKNQSNELEGSIRSARSWLRPESTDGAHRYQMPPT